MHGAPSDFNKNFACMASAVHTRSTEQGFKSIFSANQHGREGNLTSLYEHK